MEAKKLEKHLRAKEIIPLLGVSKPTFWRWVESGKIPSPIKLSPTIAVWPESQIVDFIESYRQEVN